MGNSFLLSHCDRFGLVMDAFGSYKRRYQEKNRFETLVQSVTMQTTLNEDYVEAVLSLMYG